MNGQSSADVRVIKSFDGVTQSIQEKSNAKVFVKPGNILLTLANTSVSTPEGQRGSIGYCQVKNSTACFLHTKSEGDQRRPYQATQLK